MHTAMPGRDTSKPLWENYYLARVPYIQSTSVDYMRTIGTYVTGDREVDKALSNQWVTTMMTIAQMVEYYADGAQIKIVKQADIKEIYTLISAHLDAWLHQLKYGVNIGNAPIHDLMTMDRFANEIYDHAKYHFTPDVMESLLIKGLVSASPFNPSNFFKNKDMTRKSEEEVNNGIPERESLSDHLKEHLYNLKRWK